MSITPTKKPVETQRTSTASNSSDNDRTVLVGHHLLLDEHAMQLFAMTDPIAERICKLGGLTLRSIGHIARL